MPTRSFQPVAGEGGMPKLVLVAADGARPSCISTART